VRSSRHPRTTDKRRHRGSADDPQSALLLIVIARRVVVLGVLVIAGFFTVMLLQKGHRRSGSNLTPNGAFVAALSGKQQACQTGELLPADTAALQMTIGTNGRPGPPLAVSVTAANGATLTTGGLPAGWREGVVRIPVTRTHAPTEGVRVCVRNDEAPHVGRVIALAGDVPDPGYTSEVGGRTVQNLHLRFDYLRPGSESWLQLLPVIVHRSTLGKSDLIRHFAWVAVLLLMVAAVTVALRTILADASSVQEAER
jgi:hypothetical protein